jgi:hypothetical protein
VAARGERIGLGVFASVVVGLLGAHLCCTLLYLTPPNPIRLALQAPLERYMHPWFYQSWRLFAPDPGGADAFVFVRCRAHTKDGGVESDWFDITTPLHEARYAHRLSPALLLSRAHEPKLLLRADPMNEAIRKFGIPNAVVDAAREALTAEARAQFERGRAHLIRIASIACDRRLGAGYAVEVQARYVTRKVPPFAERGNAASDWADSFTYELPWAPRETVDGY